MNQENPIHVVEVCCTWIAGVPLPAEAAHQGLYRVTLHEEVAQEILGLSALALFRKVTSLPSPNCFQIDVLAPHRKWVQCINRPVPLSDDYPVPSGTVEKVSHEPRLELGA